MAALKTTIHLRVVRSKAFDELFENVTDLRELYSLVPDYSKDEAREIVQRIMDRQNGWVKGEFLDGEPEDG